MSVLPRLTPATELGAKAVAAYADRQGVDVATFLRAGGPALTAEQVGRSVLEIAGGQTPGPWRIPTHRRRPVGTGLKQLKPKGGDQR